MDIAKIRNVAFVGHGGVGKTSLVEAILFACGASTRLGRVDDGTTTTDFDPDEIKRKISLNTAVAFADYQGHRLNLIDTPGYGDFVADARAGLRVAGAAVVVVDAVAGVQVQTEKVWKFANDFALPRAIVVNRLDRERADFFRTLESLQKRLKGRLGPDAAPDRRREQLRWGGGPDRDAGPRAGRRQDEARSRSRPISSRPPSPTARSWSRPPPRPTTICSPSTSRRARSASRRCWPRCARRSCPAISCPSWPPRPRAGIGIAPLLDLIVKEFPSPADAPEVEGTEARTKAAARRAADPKAPLSAVVFKTISDPHVGKLSVFRVYSGTLRADSQVYNASRDSRERIGHLGWLSGKTQKPVEALGPGEIGVVAKLKDTLTGDTLSDEAHPVVLPGISFPEPAISFAIQPKTRGDEDKISTALHRMAEEDPTLHHHYDPETKQLLVSGMGQLHVEVVVERMKRKYNVDVSLLPPRIPYRETVKGRAEVQGKYKKQTGGRGQYGDAWLRVEPLTRGGGFEFVDDIFGGAIPRNFIPSVEKGVRDCMKRGILAGYPVVDLKVTLYDGSYHDVDSSDMAFQIAASMGLQKGFMEAKPCLLEPVMNVEVTAPAEGAGDVIGDLNGRRGRIVGMEPDGDVVAVRAQVPMSEMLTYESSLRSMTGGRGGYSMEFSHYEEVPNQQAEKVVAAHRAEKEKH